MDCLIFGEGRIPIRRAAREKRGRAGFLPRLGSAVWISATPSASSRIALTAILGSLAVCLSVNASAVSGAGGHRRGHRRSRGGRFSPPATSGGSCASARAAGGTGAAFVAPSAVVRGLIYQVIIYMESNASGNVQGERSPVSLCVGMVSFCGFCAYRDRCAYTYGV